MAVDRTLIQRDMANTVREPSPEETFLKDLQNHIAEVAAMEGRVSMVEVLVHHPKQYQRAFEAGQRREAAYFNETLAQGVSDTEEPKRAELKHCLGVAHQAETKALAEGRGEACVRIAMTQALRAAGASEATLRAIAIVYGAMQGIDSESSLPTAVQLEQAALERDKHTRLLHYQANHLSIYRLLCRIAHGSSLQEAIEASEAIKEARLAAKALPEAPYPFEDPCLTAFAAVQDYAAKVYCSPEAEVFDIKRSTVGNGLYEATLAALQETLASAHPIHTYTVETFSNTLRALLSVEPFRIVNTFRALIQEAKPCFGLPLGLAEEGYALQKKWQTTPITHRPSVQAEINTFLSTLARRYEAFSAQHPQAGSDIELQLIAEHYQVHIQPYSHVGLSASFNPRASLRVPLFISVYENRYHALKRATEAETQPLDSPEAYIQRALPLLDTGIVRRSFILESAVAVLSQCTPLWVSHPKREAAEIKRWIAFCKAAYQKKSLQEAYQMTEAVSRHYWAELTELSRNQAAGVTEQYVAHLHALHRHQAREVHTHYLAFLNQLAKAQVDDYERSTTEWVNTRRAAIEQEYASVQGQLNTYQHTLTQHYQAQLHSIDTQTTAAINERVAAYQAYEQQVANAYQEHERQVAEYKHQRKKANKKKKRKLIQSLAGLAVGAFISPILAQSLLSGAGTLLSAIGKGALLGGISAGIGGLTLLKGH